jgi:hypothetical protein
VVLGPEQQLETKMKNSLKNSLRCGGASIIKQHEKFFKKLLTSQASTSRMQPLKPPNNYHTKKINNKKLKQKSIKSSKPSTSTKAQHKKSHLDLRS